MKILKTDKRLIDEGYRYKIEGSLVSHTDIDLTDLDKFLYVTGSIKAVGFIEAVGSIKAGGFIKAGEFIEAVGSIKAGGFIKADWHIEADGFIKSDEFIEADGHIEAGGFIEAGVTYGIAAGLQITAKDTISFGLKLFCGTCVWREITEDEKTVTCSKLIGGGTVEYGIINETGLIEKKKITLELTDEQIETLRSQGLCD